MTKLRTVASVSLGVALLGLAAGAGWAGMLADPPPVVVSEVAEAAVESEVAPQPRPKDAKPAEKGERWPLVRSLSAQGRVVAITPSGGAILVENGRAIHAIPVDGKDTPADFRPLNDVADVALSPDGRYIATAEVVNGVKLRDAATGQVIEALWPTGDLPALKVGFSADGSKLYVICSRDDSGVIRKGRGSNAGGKGGLDSAAQLKALAGGGGMPAAQKITQFTRLSVWDVATRKETAQSPFTDTSDRAAQSSFNDTSDRVGLPVYSLAGHGRLLLRIETKFEPPERNEPAQTRRVFAATDPATGKVSRTIELPDDVGVFGPDPLSPDGKLVALVESPARTGVRFIDMDTGKERFRAAGFRRPLKAVAFSPDGKRIAAATGTLSTFGQSDTIAAPSEVVIWDAGSGKELARLVDKESIRNYSALRFSPDGSYLVTETGGGGPGGGPGGISIWGNPPKPEPRKVEKPAPKVAAPADVPDRFQSLFTSLAANGTTDAKRVESLFLATLGRLPSDVEARTLVSQLAKRNDKAEALKDLLGTLVETAEFKAHAEALGRLAK